MFLELCNNKPSVAIQAILDGIEETKQNPKFKVKFSDFGHYDKKNDKIEICGATCAIQKLAGFKFSKDNIESHIDRALSLNVKSEEFFWFQISLSNFILTSATGNLGGFFNVSLPNPKPRWDIETFEQFLKQKNNIENYIKTLQELGL